MNFKINKRLIGNNQPTYIIAEMSANHNQSYDEAIKIVETAKACGADAIKLQTYTPDTLTIDCDSKFFRIKNTIWKGRKLYDLYKKSYTPWEWHSKLKNVAENIGLDFFSTPFDASAVHFLEKLNIPVYKIASFEIVDFPLIKAVAKTGKPIIISTGMAKVEEIEEAVSILKNSGCGELALLKCTSSYPAKPEDANLRTIPHMIKTFNLPIGLSDHTPGIAVPIAAVPLGACIIEKHFTLSCKNSSADSLFSLEPNEFKSMVDNIRIAEKALGTVSYTNPKQQIATFNFRKSLFVVEDITAGQEFSKKNVRSIRPGDGIHTKYFNEIIGKKALKNIAKGTPVTWDLVKDI
jgi:pseudaminic acid synthase